MLKGMVTVEDPVDGNKTASAGSELGVVTSILSQLSEFDAETRERIIQTVATFYGISLRGTGSSSRQQSGLVPLSSLAGTAFSEDRSISPKQFMFEKQPRTDVEKVGMPQLTISPTARTPRTSRTLDISETEHRCRPGQVLQSNYDNGKYR